MFQCRPLPSNRSQDFPYYDARMPPPNDDSVPNFTKQREELEDDAAWNAVIADQPLTPAVSALAGSVQASLQCCPAARHNRTAGLDDGTVADVVLLP